jgi:hypothetical protein
MSNITFLRWYALAERKPAVLDAESAWEGSHQDASKEEGPLHAHWNAMHVLEDAIFARPGHGPMSPSLG